jgi:hypothetical protein
MTDPNPYVAPDSALAATPAEKPYDKRYDGLGGWLILIGLGIVFGPFQMLSHLIRTASSVFSNGTWEAVTSTGSEAYHPFWAPFLILEIGFAAISFLVTIYMAFLFFGKSRAFPTCFIWFQSVTLVFMIVDALLLQVVRPDLPLIDPSDMGAIQRSLFGCFVWIPYMLISTRVASTFRR